MARKLLLLLQHMTPVHWSVALKWHTTDTCTCHHSPDMYIHTCKFSMYIVQELIIKKEEKGTWQLSVFSRNWIVNKTGLTLQYRAPVSFSKSGQLFFENGSPPTPFWYLVSTCRGRGVQMCTSIIPSLSSLFIPTTRYVQVRAFHLKHT